MLGVRGCGQPHGRHPGLDQNNPFRHREKQNPRLVASGLLSVERKRFERPHESPEKPAPPTPGGAESGAQAAAPGATHPDLASVIAVWANLPEPIKAAVLALIRAAGR
jgi:hypothetical protein